MRFPASWAWLLLALATAPVAHAQFDLFLVENGQERGVTGAYNLGSFYTNETALTTFRLRNTSSSPATLSVLTVAGVGFVLSSPKLPLGVAPQGTVELSVAFRAADTGAYSASLNANGISILLTVLILPRLAYRVDPALGPSQSGPFPGPLDFGRVVLGNSVGLRIRYQNESSQVLNVPAIATQGTDFALTVPSPSGQLLQPGQGGEFTLGFTPRTPGERQGSLILGDRSYSLAGICIDSAPPTPILSIDLNQAASAQQGTLTVRYDPIPQVGGTVTATIAAAGGSDSAIGFSNGGRLITFTYAPGDRQASFGFQTGTTAGNLTFTVAVNGGVTAQQTVAIPAAAPAIFGMQTVRSGGVVELRITGFDNTRSLSALAFTFYDVGGNVIAPGVIRADAAADFSRYFAASDLGGVFLLRLAFPVTGDSSGIASCDAALTNSAGSTKTARTTF